MSANPAYAMSALCGVGGIIGFMRTGSLPSIVAGVSVGALYAFSGRSIASGDNNGYTAAFAASVLLLVSSLPRIHKSIVPAFLSVTAATTGYYYGGILRELGIISI